MKAYVPDRVSLSVESMAASRKTGLLLGEGMRSIRQRMAALFSRRDRSACLCEAFSCKNNVDIQRVQHNQECRHHIETIEQYVMLLCVLVCTMLRMGHKNAYNIHHVQCAYSPQWVA